MDTGTSTTNRTDRQIALWNYWNRWIEVVGDQFMSKSYVKKFTVEENKVAQTSVSKKLTDDSQAYANGWYAATHVSITGNNTLTIANREGSYKVDYSGYENVEIYQVNVTYTDGSVLPITNTSAYFPIYNSTSDRQNKTNNISVNQIKSGQAFYFTNNTNKNIKNITFYVHTKTPRRLWATMYLLTSRGKQNLLMVDRHNDDPIWKYADTTVAVTETPPPVTSYGSVRLNKFAKSKSAEGTDCEENTNASFKIYCQNKGQWVTGNANGTKGYTYSFEDATVYSANSSVEINNLISNNRYYFVEVDSSSVCKNDSGIPELYNATTTADNVGLEKRTPEETRSICLQSYYSIGLIIKENTTIETNVINRKLKGTLSIRKQDRFTYGNIKGIKLRIYAKFTDGEGKVTKEGWLSSNGSIISGDEGYSSSNKYSTDNNGEVILYSLSKGEYYIYEVETAENYNLEAQRNMYQDSGDPNKFAGKSFSVSGTTEKPVYLGMANIQFKDTEDTNINTTVIKNVQMNFYQYQLSNLKIIKEDIATKQKISNVGIKILVKVNQYINYGQNTFKVGSFAWLKSDGSLVEDEANANTFYTDKNGQITVNNLPLGTYYIYEVKANSEYYLSRQGKYKAKYPTDYKKDILGNGKGVYSYIGETQINKENINNTKTITVTNRKISLTIYKRDGTYANDLGVNETLELKGVNIKIYADNLRSEDPNNKEGWLKKTTSNGVIKYEYTKNYKEATTFTTDEHGQVFLPGVRYGTYYVYEVKAADGYNIKEQDGYRKSANGSKDITQTDWVYLGNITLTSAHNAMGKYFDNNKYTKIKGKVWIDDNQGKANVKNSLYDTNEQGLKDIKVRLWNRKTGALLAETTTNSNGEYEFKTLSNNTKLTYWQAAYCFVDFTYDNTRYVVVDPFKDELKEIARSSKAQEEKITKDLLDDSKLAGTKGANSGRATTYQTTAKDLTKKTIYKNKSGELKQRLLTSYYNQSTYTIENINLGLWKKATPDHQIDQEISYVKLVKGDKVFRYEYGDNAIIDGVSKKTQVGVRYQNSTKTFTQYIYPSDIKYNVANNLTNNSNEAFKVYIVYKINVKNNTTLNDKDIYVEKKLYLEELNDQFDNKRLELSKDKTSMDTNNIVSDFDLWTTENNGNVAKLNMNSSNNKKAFKKGNTGLNPNAEETTYIQFRVKNEALNKLANNTLDQRQAATVISDKAYHEYTRDDNNWKEEKTYTHKSAIEERKNNALSVSLKLSETRTISGNVFEDNKVNQLSGERNNTRKDERIGDGKYSNGENKLSNVIVTLMDKNGNVANLYDGNVEYNSTTGKWTSAKKTAIVNVGNDGTYELKGIVPGEYYLKFTYGDGKTETKDVNGNTINIPITTKSRGNNINSQYYKSTILTGSAKNATDGYWYLNDMGKNNSIATDKAGTYYDKNGNVISGKTNIDIIKSRTESTEEIKNSTSNERVVIDATSPNVDINFEYQRENRLNHNDDLTTDNKKKMATNCRGMSFGIIERPHIQIDLEEKISNVKLTLQNGTKVINGDPSSANVSQYLAKMGDQYAKVEMDPATLYGAEAEITYQIKVINNSELDYASKDYYTKGTVDTSKLVKTEVTKIVSYVGNKNESFKDVDSRLEESNTGITKDDYFAPGVIDYNKNYNQKLLSVKSGNTKQLTPKKKDANGCFETYNVTVSQLLTNTQNDMGSYNYSEIIGIKNVSHLTQYQYTMGNYKVGDSTTNQGDNGDSAVTITTPTGKNKSYMILIVSAISLVVLGTGIFMIKKYVLKK